MPLNGFIYAALRVLKVTQGQQAQRVLQEHRDHRVQLGQQDLQAPQAHRDRPEKMAVELKWVLLMLLVSKKIFSLKHYKEGEYYYGICKRYGH